MRLKFGEVFQRNFIKCNKIEFSTQGMNHYCLLTINPTNTKISDFVSNNKLLRKKLNYRVESGRLIMKTSFCG